MAGKLPRRTLKPPKPSQGRRSFTGKGARGTGLGYHGKPRGATTPAKGKGYHGKPPHPGATTPVSPKRKRKR